MKLSMQSFPDDLASELGRLKDDESLRQQSGQHPWLGVITAAGVYPGFAGLASFMAFGWPKQQYFLPLLLGGLALGVIHMSLLQRTHRSSKEELRWKLPLYLLDHLPLRQNQKMSLMVDDSRLQKGRLRWLESTLTLSNGSVLHLKVDRQSESTVRWVEVRARKMRSFREVTFHDRLSIQSNLATQWSAERQELLSRRLAELEWNLVQVDNDATDGSLRIEVTTAICRYEVQYAHPDGEFDTDLYLKAVQLLLDAFAELEAAPSVVNAVSQPSGEGEIDSPFEFEDSTT